MTKRFIIAGGLLALCHLVLLGIAFSISFSARMDRFDNPQNVPTAVERCATAMVMVLLQPANSLWTPWMSKNMPNIFEWALLFANSLLWGYVFALPVSGLWRLRDRVFSDNKSVEPMPTH